MEHISNALPNVKRIIEAVNLRTNDVDLYTINDRGISEKPFNMVPRRFEDIVADPGGRAFIGCGPDVKTIMAGQAVIEPPWPIYEGDVFLYLERPEHIVAMIEPLKRKFGIHDTEDEFQKRDRFKEDPHHEPKRENSEPSRETEPEADFIKTVGRDLKLAWLPAEIYESVSFQKLKLGEQELYRIYRTYCKVAGRDSRYSYMEIGVKQSSVLLKRRKQEMIGFSKKNSMEEVDRIGTDERTIKRYSLALQKAGWLKKVRRGYPSENGAFVNKFQVVKSEKQRYRAMRERKLRVVH
jgi:hypothetical protein